VRSLLREIKLGMEPDGNVSVTAFTYGKLLFRLLSGCLDYQRKVYEDDCTLRAIIS
jgi:hypothetical protein